MGTLEYSSNNSGGSWWLNDADWKALEEAGWVIEWAKDRKGSFLSADKDGRWLGALATGASKETDDPEAAIAEWASITGQDPDAEGCNCCGEPHEFSYDGQYRIRQYAAVSTSWI